MTPPKSSPNIGERYIFYILCVNMKGIQMLVAETSGEYELAPVGVYRAVCTRLLNMGLQETNYGVKHQIHLAFEIDENMADDRPFLMMQNYTVSLNTKARLRKDLEAWRGRAFTGEELQGFDLKTVLGKPLQISVVHSEDGKYANIGAMMPLGRGQQALAPAGELLYINSLPEDNNSFELLSERMKERIETGLKRFTDSMAPMPVHPDPMPSAKSFQAPPPPPPP
ncbi:hypothetical protein, partial [uncultured Planktomarina sp.]|uniref:phage replication initiation protein, NGO0469 family n=1 Tax=uncultured Planktomarina sp. TaxID=1538529 RepID=UPI003261AB45